MLVMKCSRLLRFGSSPSVKLLKAVIGICPYCLSAFVVTPSGSKWPVRLALLFLGSRRRGRWQRQIGIEHVSPDFPFAVGLFFPNLAVLALILGAVFHRQLVGADQTRHVARFRHFHPSGFPADVRQAVEKSFPQISNASLRCDH